MPRKNSITRRNRSVKSDNTDTRVFFYCRASTKEQTNSTSAQQKCAKDFASTRTIFIDEVISDDASSAVKVNFLDRPKVKAMLATMRRRNISTVLILRPDRVFRSSYDYNLSLKWLSENGFYLRFIEPDLDLSTPFGKVILQMLVSMAELECNMKSERVDNTLEDLRSERVARGNNAPYGWALTDEVAMLSHKSKAPLYRLTPIQSEQTILRHIIHLWDTTEKKHGALSRIARELNALTIPTKMAGQTIMRHGTTHNCSGNWTAAAVKSVIEHAVIATPEELENPTQTLQQAIQQLTTKSLAA